MKRIIFLAHDPGGYDVVCPVFSQYQNEGSSGAAFYCIGPAGRLNSQYSIPEDGVLNIIKGDIESNSVLALVTGTSWGVDYELEAVLLCREAGIPTLSILDYWVNYRLRLTGKSGKEVYPDYYVVMDELAKSEAIKEGVPAKIIYPLGHPGLDRIINKGRKVKSIRKDENNISILFLSQPLSQLYGDSLGYTEQTVIEDCIHAVHDLPNAGLNIKFHPRDYPWLIKNYNHLKIDGDLLDLVSEYNLVIGMNTMGLLHSVIRGIPTISFQPNLQQADVCITNKLGITALITSRNELKEFLLVFKEGNLPDYNKSISNFIWRDGRSTERVFDLVQEVVNREN